MPLSICAGWLFYRLAVRLRRPCQLAQASPDAWQRFCLSQDKVTHYMAVYAAFLPWGPASDEAQPGACHQCTYFCSSRALHARL